MSKILNLINGLFSGEPKEFSRQDLSDCIYKVFSESLRRQTTKEGLLFDTNYVVYLPSQIYDGLEASFAHTAKEVANRFHKTLQSIVPSYPNYKPHSRCWKIRFVNATEDVDLGKYNEELKSNKILILSSLYVEKRRGQTIKKGKDTCVLTVLTSKKKVEDSQVDSIAIEGLTVLDKASFEIKMNNFEKVTDLPVSDSDKTENDYVARAILKLKKGNFTDDSEFFYMTKESLYVVGPDFPTDDLTSNDELAVIEGDFPKEFFLHIEALKDSKFIITGDADTLLNESIHLVPNKAKPIQDNSSLILFDGREINFSIIK